MHRFTLLGFASLVSSVALVSGAFTACSSSSDTGPGTSPEDTGGIIADTAKGDTNTTPTDTNTTPTDTTTTPTDTTTPPDDGGTDGSTTCGSDPTLHPLGSDAGAVPGVYCPGAGADAGASTCDPGLICCDTPKGSTPASSCIASTATCPTTTPKAGSSWACDAPQHCGTGKICCGKGTPKLRTGCTYEEVFPALGTQCETACATGEYIVCEAAGDCPTGKTCTPIKSGGKQVGYCK